jgi:hypothetical protein
LKIQDFFSKVIAKEKNMKWVLFCAAVIALQGEEKPVCPPDLFKQNDQVYSGQVEFLYWTITESDLDYALKMRHAAWGPSPSYAQGRFETAEYQLDPGFRVCLNYFRAPHYWELKWQYTRLTCRGDNNTGKPTTDSKCITGTWPQITPAPLAGAKSHIHFNYNVFEMLVDRVFFPNPHLRLRVLGGGLTSWMDQDWKIRYYDSAPHTTTIRNRWHFVGAGLKSGMMADWYWTGNIYMTAMGSISALIGAYSNHAKQTTTYQPLPSDNTAIPIRDTSLHDTRPVFSAQMLLGPSWQKNFPRNRVELFAGFEMNLWMNLQEIYRSTSGGPFDAKETWINASTLALYGLTTRLTVDF